MKGRLNVFQKSMLQWNDLHPYNAVHVVRIPGRADVERLKGVIARTLEGKGLTGLELNRRAGTYQYHGGPSSAEIRIINGEAAWSSNSAQEIARQLNTPFALQERFTPFRFLVMPGVDSFILGLVYFHAVADAESILMLLRAMVDWYRGEGDPGAASPVERHPPRWDKLRKLPPGVMARELIALPSLIRDLRRTSRPRYREVADFNNGFAFFALGPQALGGLVRAAKSLGVTLNDLFLALLMQAVARLAPDRARAGRRQGISLGCVVNVRKDLGLAGREVFGLFLGSFLVHHRVPAGITLADLARDIGRQTLRIKRARLYLGSALEMAIGRLAVSLYSERRRKELYRKHYPLWGGLSNMDLNALWPQRDESQAVDYWRAVSTGPVTPLVMSISTLGRVANIGLTYRSTVFSAADIERIQSCFLDPPELLAGGL